MKLEKRGKYGGVKVHLEPEECQLFAAGEINSDLITLVVKIGAMIRALMKEEPGLLQDRTEAEIIAILVKEREKAALQLAQLKAKQDWKSVDPKELKKALLKHVG